MKTVNICWCRLHTLTLAFIFIEMVCSHGLESPIFLQFGATDDNYHRKRRRGGRGKQNYLERKKDRERESKMSNSFENRHDDGIQAQICHRTHIYAYLWSFCLCLSFKWKNNNKSRKEPQQKANVFSLSLFDLCVCMSNNRSFVYAMPEAIKFVLGEVHDLPSIVVNVVVLMVLLLLLQLLIFAFSSAFCIFNTFLVSMNDSPPHAHTHTLLIQSSDAGWLAWSK